MAQPKITIFTSIYNNVKEALSKGFSSSKKVKPNEEESLTPAANRKEDQENELGEPATIVQGVKKRDRNKSKKQ